MKITARVKGENAKLVETLNSRGISAKMVRGGVIVELAKNSADDYEIPKEVNSALLLLNVAECGGGATNTGKSTIVCGTSGEALNPYYIPKGGHLSCGEHAFFAVRDGVVTIEGLRPGNFLTIKEHRIIRDSNTAWIESTVLWTGWMEDLPVMFDYFEAAIDAAILKAHCYHCREPHFVEVPE